jgi:hypothetical protein
MAALRQLALLGFAPLLNSCASTPLESDELCRAIARFADASSMTEPHTVRLSTDWGGVFANSNNPNESFIAAKTCHHDAAEAGQSLCAYLLENTSTEFAGINYRRALDCIGVRPGGLSPTDNDSLPPRATGGVVNGKRVRSTVTLEYSRGSRDSPPVLSISSGAQINR